MWVYSLVSLVVPGCNAAAASAQDMGEWFVHLPFHLGTVLPRCLPAAARGKLPRCRPTEAWGRRVLGRLRRLRHRGKTNQLRPLRLLCTGLRPCPSRSCASKHPRSCRRVSGRMLGEGKGRSRARLNRPVGRDSDEGLGGNAVPTASSVTPRAAMQRARFGSLGSSWRPPAAPAPREKS